MKQLTYDQTLKIVDQFIINSGIRDYCTNVCGGKCCQFCAKCSEESCMVIGDTRLSCTIYLCGALTDKLFTKYERKLFYKIQEKILHKVYKHKQNKSLRPMYYYPPKPAIKKEKFPMFICALSRFNTKKIKNKLKKIK